MIGSPTALMDRETEQILNSNHTHGYIPRGALPGLEKFYL